MQRVETKTKSLSAGYKTAPEQTKHDSPLLIADDLRLDLLKNMDEFCRSVRKVDPNEGLTFIVSEKYLKTQVEFYSSIFRLHGINPHTARILEVGSGYGFFLCYARNILGWNLWGIEPGEAEFSGRDEIAARLLRDNSVEPERLKRCPGEAIAFDNDSFDVVISNDVIEHVANPEKVIEESCRVLKPGGLIVFNIPNYNWIYEGHYNTPWLPSMPKSLARSFVSLLGRDPSFVDTLNFLTPTNVREMVLRNKELQLLHPLDYNCKDFLPLRLEAYLDAHKSSQTTIRRKFLELLSVICTKQAWKTATQIVARSTAMYHEMHLIARKLR